jgi:hypothetical protein
MLMKTLMVPAFAVFVVLLSSGPLAAQQRAVMHGVFPNTINPGRGLSPSRSLSTHAINPSLSLSAPATSPLQQQMQDNYATGLMGAQRELLQQNPSGLGRQELAIGHELNGFSPR